MPGSQGSRLGRGWLAHGVSSAFDASWSSSPAREDEGLRPARHREYREPRHPRTTRNRHPFDSSSRGPARIELTSQRPSCTASDGIRGRIRENPTTVAPWESSRKGTRIPVLHQFECGPLLCVDDGVPDTPDASRGRERTSGPSASLSPRKPIGATPPTKRRRLG